MKSFIITLIIVCATATAGTVIYLDRQKTPRTPTPVVESSPKQAEEAPQEKIAVSKPESQPAVSQNADASSQIPVVNSAVNETNPDDDSTNSIHKSVDALLSAKNGRQRQELFDQLQKGGQLDSVISELQQRAAQNPNDPEIPTTLGEAELNKLRAVRDAGGDNNDIGILAMQADQNFNAALKIDPSNWEAQFVKASALAGWPVELNKGPEVIQQLSSLIDQQETMTPQSQFAQTYVVLGDEYQKIGQPDKALATWQLGVQKFPNDPTLQQRISSR
jgi:tetratricopeptide (TPR) repeat protein